MSPDRPEAHVLLHGDETGAVVSATEIVVPPRSAGPPLHRHDFDEAFYVLDGELTFQIDGVLTTGTPGALRFAPRNVVHALANHGEVPARYLLICTPAGFERHWAREAAQAAGTPVPPWASAPTPEVVVVGPPLPMTAGQ